MSKTLISLLLVAVLCVSLAAPTLAKDKKGESKVFVPVADAPGYQLAVDIIAFTSTFEEATRAVSFAKTALVQMSSNKAVMDTLDAKIKSAQSIEKPEEKDAALKSANAERDSLCKASAAELEAKKDLSADQKVLLGKIGKNLMIAAAFDAMAVARANDLTKQCTATSSDITGQISKNPLKAGKLKANQGFITAASTGTLPAVATGAPSQAADITSMLVTVGKMAAANGVTLPDPSSVTATDRIEN
jgi:hypothetical protein